MVRERGESSASQEYENAITRRRRLISLLHGPLSDNSLRSSTQSAAEASRTQGAQRSSQAIKMSSQAEAKTVNTASENNSQSGAQQTMVMDSEKGSAGGAGQENAPYDRSGNRSQGATSARVQEQSSGSTYPALPTSAPATPALNDQITQAVQFTNFQNFQGLETMISVPDDVMTKQSNGHASQDAETYMNGVMQISMAAQAIVAAKIAQNPALGATDAIKELNTMVTNAIAAFQDVS